MVFNQLYSFVAKVTMRVAEYCLILCSLFLNSNALNCKTEGGPKEKELKKIYSFCVKQKNKNNSNMDENSDQDWRESRRYNQWSGNNQANNRGNANDGYGMEEESQVNGNRMNNRDRTDERHKMSRQDEGSNSNESMQHRDRDGDDMYSRNARGEKKNRNSGNQSQRNNGVDARNDFFQNENFDGYNNNQYSTQPTRRYKRERRVEVNSGKRSQYNPNPQRFSGYEEKYKEEGKNSSKNNSTSDDNNNACAVQCLLENLKMTDDNGMPDRYLVTHTIMKDAKDENLKDFLQEAVEECFQILDNENTEDKCEFSKNLLICLSEKGRNNCDDWKDDYQF